MIAGVSYGGLIAAEFAARRPERVQRPGAGQRAARVVATRSSGSSAISMRRFDRADVRGDGAAGRAQRKCWPRCRRFGRSPALHRGARARGSCSRRARRAKMARRIAWARAHRFADRAGRDTSRRSLVTGEPELDRVVPVDVTRRYLNDFARAEHVVLERTGHNGLVTRPDAFAEVLERFVDGVRLSA